MADTRSRGWCVTINNYENEENTALGVAQVGFWEQLGCRYAIIGKEVGAEGTPHLQVYLYWDNPRRFSAVKKLLPTAHLEVARGTAEHNRTYCSKGEDVLCELGNIPKPGKRKDLEVVRDLVKSGHKMGDIIEVATGYQSLKGAELMLKYIEPNRDAGSAPPTVLWFWGPTGCGKSRLAFESYPNAWVASTNLDWFDGYDGHDEVILDDFRADWCKFSWLLRVLDRYPLRVPVKGGFRAWVPKVIVVTAPVPPRLAYRGKSSDEDVQQLCRRITEVREFDCNSLALLWP